MTNYMKMAEIHRHLIKDDGIFPNNKKLPLLIYKSALVFDTGNAADYTEKIFNKNLWTNSWRNGIYDYHHYHSNTHEVLGIYSGKAKVQLGGLRGITVEIEKGDVVVIPAGVSHKCIKADEDFF